MYKLIFFIFAALAIFLVFKGLKTQKKALTILGITTGILTVFFSWFLGFWGEKLWFDQLGYNQRFWTVWLTKVGIFAGIFIISGLYVFLLTINLKEKWQKNVRFAAVLGGAFLSGLWLSGEWDKVLLFLNRTTTSVTDPILHMQTGFYLFTYPVLRIIYSTLMFLSFISLIASLLAGFKLDSENAITVLKDKITKNNAISINIGIILIILALGKYIDRFGLLYSKNGIVNGPGWTDVNIRLPIYTFISVLTIVAGFIMMIPSVKIRLTNLLMRKKNAEGFAGLLAIPIFIISIWIIILAVVPGLFQRLKVEPNEITVERPYIKNNIQFTRFGYNLNKVEEREYPVSEKLPETTFTSNQKLLSNIRLWDYRALDAVYKQFQEIRLYYEFRDVDIDRYHFNNSYNQVMVSAREMETGNLPAESQTFVNKRFKYTHGYGITMNPVSEFTQKGLPNLLIKDIPPVSKNKDLEVTRPEIYYGEITDDYVVVNSKEKEFDYPSGENNIYANYQGKGGVQLSSFWRKFLYGSQHGGTRFLLSGYASRESRIMFHRQIKQRVEKLAPFLSYDDDPYIVLNNGKLYWMIDAYTTSQFYPYSEPFTSMKQSGYSQNYDERSLFSGVRNYLGSENYIRNSVKITVDAYSGEVNMYIFDKEDPLINVYDHIFSGLFKDKSEMPQGLREHVRYPIDMLQIQGLVYAKYHMTNPDVFYNQEDLWVQATEKYYSGVQAVEPYYIMWSQPGSDKVEFTLVLPFTPKDKQVMIGWIAGLCDGDNYGQFLAYKFPKEKRILGPQQMETKIDQDSYLSGQLTLWDQRGSSVIRGNLLAIPIDGTIIYVEPIFLQSETSAYPELRLVAVMQDDNLSYAETFDKAIANLLTKSEYQQPTEKTDTETEPKTGLGDLIKTANASFENYLDYMQQKKFDKAGEALENLQKSLEKLSDEKE